MLITNRCALRGKGGGEGGGEGGRRRRRCVRVLLLFRTESITSNKKN